MMENDTQNSRQASVALHNAPKLAKIAQAGIQGGPAGAAAEAAVQYRKEVLVVVVAVLLLPVLVLLMLPGAIFGTLTQPSTAINNDLEVAGNVIQLRNAVSDILQAAYEDTLAEIDSERASLTYSDVVDSVGGHVSYNAFQLISMYSAYQGEDDYTKISLADLSAQVQAHHAEYYTYTTSEQLPAGTYYVAVQALSKDEQILDSKVSSAMEIVLTDEEAAPDFSDEYSVAKTELWKDPQQMDMPGANPFQVPERVDLYSNQETASIIE